MSEEEVKNSMYIGPTVARLGLKRSTLIIGSQPMPQLLSLIERNPIIKSLFVPTSQVAIARQKLAISGSLEDIASKTVLKLTEVKQEKRNK